METGAEQNEMTKQANCTQHYETLMELGDCLTTVGKYDEAQKHYERAALLDQDAAGPYVGLGVIAVQKEKLDDAEIAFRVACRLEPDCGKAYAGQAIVAQQRKDYAGAFNMYMKCLELENDNLTALLGLFQVSCRMGSFEKIIHYLRVYLDMHPGDASVMFALATLYMRDKRLDESRKILRDVLVLQPGHGEAAKLLEEVEREITIEKQPGMG
jgi:tetratricopeptide (TPR) repeat protein